MCFSFQVLNVWAKRGTSEAAERCEAILDRMEYLRQKSSLHIEPTTFSFATVMKAWANARDVNGTERAERAEYILQQLLKVSSDKKNMDRASIIPDTVVFNSGTSKHIYIMGSPIVFIPIVFIQLTCVT